LFQNEGNAGVWGGGVGGREDGGVGGGRVVVGNPKCMDLAVP
jgi:hypothetical protein